MGNELLNTLDEHNEWFEMLEAAKKRIAAWVEDGPKRAFMVRPWFVGAPEQLEGTLRAQLREDVLPPEQLAGLMVTMMAVRVSMEGRLFRYVEYSLLDLEVQAAGFYPAVGALWGDVRVTRREDNSLVAHMPMLYPVTLLGEPPWDVSSEEVLGTWEDMEESAKGCGVPSARVELMRLVLAEEGKYGKEA